MLHLVSEAVGCLRRRLELELWLGFIRDSIEKIPGDFIIAWWYSNPKHFALMLILIHPTCGWSWGVVSGDKALLLLLLVVVVFNVLVHVHLDQIICEF